MGSTRRNKVSEGDVKASGDCEWTGSTEEKRMHWSQLTGKGLMLLLHTTLQI